MPAGWDPGFECRWPGEEWTTVMSHCVDEAQDERLAGEGSGFPPRPVPVEPEGGWSEPRASPALFPTAAAAFFGPSLSSASPRDYSQRAGALGGPGLGSGHWGQTRPWEVRAGRDPLGDPCCSLSGPMWPPHPPPLLCPETESPLKTCPPACQQLPWDQTWVIRWTKTLT